MKTIYTILIFLILCPFIHAQNYDANDTSNRIEESLKEIDVSLKNIDTNVMNIKEEIVKENEKPFLGQSIFEDRKDNSAIFLPYGGTFRLSTADASLKLSYVFRISNKHLYYGIDFSGKSNDGLVPLISKGDISPGARVNLNIGLKEIFTRKKDSLIDGWVNLKLGYEGSIFKLYNADSTFSNQIRKVSFNTARASLSFNFKMGGTKLIALSIGYQKVNNYEDLDEIELTDKKIDYDSLTTVLRSFESKTKVRIGDYQTYDQFPLNLDFYWVIGEDSRFGIYNFLRTMITNGKITNGFGTGLYLLKNASPLSSIAGIVFEVKDLSKLKEGFDKNFTINFLIGYNFGY
ncbi:MAG: hypothetical protein K8I03_05710 [Ignavibacteria bacterium]|nr:hypothetical protein [Ignavibacteria bacterium]